MSKSLRRMILNASKANMAFLERWQMWFAQLGWKLQQIGGYVIPVLFFLGLLVFAYVILSRHADPFSDALTWNLWGCVVLSVASIGTTGTTVFVRGIQPYLPLDERRWLYANAVQGAAMVLVISAVSIVAVAAAFGKSQLPWYSVGGIAIAAAFAQTAVVLLLATQKLIGISLRNWIAYRTGVWFWLGMLFSMAGLLLLSERFWPSFSHVRWIAWIVPPTWPTLLVSQIDFFGLKGLIAILSILALVCGGLAALLIQRDISSQSLWEFDFNEYPGNGPTVHPGAWAYFMTREELKHVAIPDAFIAAFDAKRSSAEEQVEQFYLESYGGNSDSKPQSMSRPSQCDLSVFQTWIKSALSTDELRMLHVARANMDEPFKLLDLNLPHYLTKLIVAFLIAIFIPKSLLVLAICPATMLINSQIMPHFFYNKIEKVQWLPIDPRVMLRAETKYRLLCAIPIFFSCVVIFSPYVASVSIGPVVYAISAAKFGLAFAIALPAVMALSFVGSLRCRWINFSELKFALSVGIGLVVGILGIAVFLFPEPVASSIGAIAAILSSRWLWQTCIGWYETGATDIAA